MTITHKPLTFKERVGDHRAAIEEIEVVESTNFDESKPNSTTHHLTVVFSVEDPESLERSIFTERFISPLTGGRGLFQQLVDAAGAMLDVEGGEFDEQDFVGLELIVTFGKRKGKDDRMWDTIVNAVAEDTGKKKKKAPKKEEPEDDDDNDFPFK